MAGWETEQMMEGLESVLHLAEATQMDLGNASDIVSNMMTAFGMSAEEAGRATDVLAKTSFSANTDVSALGETMKYLAPAAAAVGMSLEEASAMAGMLADAGISGTMAGTSLNAMLTDLSSLSDGAREHLQEMGISIYDAQGNMRPMVDILGEMEHATKDMNDEQRIAFEQMVFNERGLKAYRNILSQGVDSLRDFTGELENSSGTVQEARDIMKETLSYQLSELKSQLEGTALELGSVLVPIIKDTVIPIVQKVSQFILDLATRFAEMDPFMQNTIITIIALVAALGPALIIFGKITAAVGSIISFITPLIPAIKLVGATIAGLAAPIAIAIGALALIYLAFRNWDKIVDFIKKVVESISGFMGGLIDSLQSKWEGFSGFFKNLWEGITTTFKSIANSIIDLVNKMIAGLNRFSIDVPGWVESLTGMSSFGFNISSIPRLAKGGIIQSPGVVMVGERGPEMLHLPKGAAVEPLGAGGGFSISIQNAYMSNERDIDTLARKLDERLRARSRRA